eukprot:765497-Hanusia_phi.AAC.2
MRRGNKFLSVTLASCSLATEMPPVDHCEDDSVSYIFQHRPDQAQDQRPCCLVPASGGIEQHALTVGARSEGHGQGVGNVLPRICLRASALIVESGSEESLVDP